MPTLDRRFSIHAVGLARFRSDLRKIDRDLARGVDGVLRGIGRKVRDEARANLRARSKRPQNRIEKTIQSRVRTGGVIVLSDHPGAGVEEFGGTIEPRGAPIEIEGKHYLIDAAEANMEYVEEELGTLLDAAADRHGFTGKT